MKRIMLRSIALHRGEKQDSLFAWPSCQVAGHLHRLLCWTPRQGGLHLCGDEDISIAQR